MLLSFLSMMVALGFSPDSSIQPRAVVPDGAYLDPSGFYTLKDGREIHLACIGEGERTVIFLAGLGEWGYSWREIMPTIASEARTCALDRPGTGLSGPDDRPPSLKRQADTIAAVLDAASIQGPVTVVGHSIGGLEAAIFADHYPQRVSALLLIDPTPPDFVNIFQTYAPGQAAAMKAAFVDQRGALMRECAELANEGNNNRPDECRLFSQGLPESLAHAVEARLDDPEQWATLQDYAELFFRVDEQGVRVGRDYGSTPILLLEAGAAGQVPADAPNEVKEETAKLWPRVRDARYQVVSASDKGKMVVVPGASHQLHKDEPDLVIRAILEMLGTD